MSRLLLTGLLLQLGCAAPAVGTAALNTAIAASASAISRAQGNCYANCPEGTACNHANGLCEEVPCRGHCAADEQCLPTPLPHCVPAASDRLHLDTAPPLPKVPGPERP